MIMYRIVFIITLCFGVTSIEAQELRGRSEVGSLKIKGVTETSQADETLSEIGDYYALIIGVDYYIDDRINDLDQPIADATKLYQVLLDNYTFDKENIIFIKNPSRSDIIIMLDELGNTLQENDNLLFFYAGHGYWDEEKELGYWLPSDAMQSNTANWIRNTTVQSYIGALNTKHTLLIADACFAGGIFKTRRVFNDAPKAIEKVYALPSRKAMTSGTLKEVPDRSVFLEYLLKRLAENREKYISSEQLFTSFREAVLNNSPNVPQYGTIHNSGDEGGDFIFIHK